VVVEELKENGSMPVDAVVDFSVKQEVEINLVLVKEEKAGKELDARSAVVEEDKDYDERDRNVVVKDSVEDSELPVDAVVDFSVRQSIAIVMVFVAEFSDELLTRNVLEIRVCTLILVRASVMAGSVKLQLNANISAALTRSHQVVVELCQRIQNALLLNGTRMVGVIWDQKPVKVKETIDSICSESEKDQAGKELDAQSAAVVEEDKDYVETDRNVVDKRSVEDGDMPVDVVVDFSVRQQNEINLVFVVEEKAGRELDAQAVQDQDQDQRRRSVEKSQKYNATITVVARAVVVCTTIPTSAPDNSAAERAVETAVAPSTTSGDSNAATARTVDASCARDTTSASCGARGGTRRTARQDTDGKTSRTSGELAPYSTGRDNQTNALNKQSTQTIRALMAPRSRDWQSEMTQSDASASHACLVQPSVTHLHA